jgi:hypothetical protein
VVIVLIALGLVMLARGFDLLSRSHFYIALMIWSVCVKNPGMNARGLSLTREG